MKKFNPDRELYKIKYGKRNKIILSIFLLLVVISIGSTYALYQVRHSKRIIYTTVSDFSKDIKLAVYVDGVKQNDFPKKTDGYIYNGIECDNTTNLKSSWDYNNWTLNLESEVPNKCTINFISEKKANSLFDMNLCKSNDLLNECLLKNGNYLTETFNNDPDNNIRFVGRQPNNYIYFNCDNYDNPTAETCELWRIVGLFNMTVVNGEIKNSESLVKIIRNDAIGKIVYDKDGEIAWDIASLQKGLNGPYLTEGDLGDWITSNEYTYLSGAKNIKSKYRAINSVTKEKIANVIWPLGGAGISKNYSAQEFYNIERDNVGVGDLATEWIGKVALIYPSDFLYATSTKECSNVQHHSPGRNCWDDSYLGYNNSTIDSAGETMLKWTISCSGFIFNEAENNYDGTIHNIQYLQLDGEKENHLRIHNTYATTIHWVLPSLYLNSNIKIIGGNGSYSDPYIIK